ncbi:TraB/GumN family protein [Alisedimentitalea sp. MJ-SS2]|uniref:TraB/GumN family protein n=1 Tax=Aliisedimentitalea sp. MJ-SS2 TaxID=3049795 RepID=UPI00290A4DEC|nr:TraB/GumN family protein [Alisedimentitalea sp. MJ-SS2]MDU8927920.1 TraB/GumN family protein [Alisedimentitalea sp. MJ-SS2]
MFGLSAQAQSWVTPAVCEVDTPRIDAHVLSAERLDALRSEAAKIPNAVGNFWRITAPDGAVSHVWGTMHSSDRHVLTLPDIVIDEITRARLLAIEADYTAESRAELARLNDPEGWFREYNGRDPVSYESLGIPAAITEALNARLEAASWGRDAQDLLTFGGLLEAVWADPCEDFANGVLPIQDARIQMLAHIAGVPTKGLEPPDRFLRRVNHPDATELARALLMMTGSYLEETNAATLQADRSTFFALYLAGEHALLERWDRAEIIARFGSEGGQRIYNTSMDYLLSERNHDFLAAIRDDLHQGGVFMAIGASHLSGRNGIVELMRRDGFEVTRIKLERER